jgi:hypothetical protein
MPEIRFGVQFTGELKRMVQSDGVGQTRARSPVAKEFQWNQKLG